MEAEIREVFIGWCDGPMLSGSWAAVWNMLGHIPSAQCPLCCWGSQTAFLCFQVADAAHTTVAPGGSAASGKLASGAGRGGCWRLEWEGQGKIRGRESASQQH